MPDRFRVVEGGITKRESLKLPSFHHIVKSPSDLKMYMGELYDAAEPLFNSVPIEPGMFTQEEVDAALARIVRMMAVAQNGSLTFYDYYKQFYNLLERALEFPEITPDSEFALEAIALLQAGGVLERETPAKPTDES